MKKIQIDDDEKVKKVTILLSNRKSSINFKKAKTHAMAHNFRTDEPSYLLDEKNREKNEFWRHEKSAKNLFDEELAKSKRKGGRIPRFENSYWEAVMNLEAHHTMKDLEKLTAHIEKKFNITCTARVIHRDEGHVDILTGEIHRNYHAHVNFQTFQNGKQNWRREHIRPQHLRELQGEVAEMLNMERGEEGSTAKRKEHGEYRKLKIKEENLILKKEIQDLKGKLKTLERKKKNRGFER